LSDEKIKKIGFIQCFISAILLIIQVISALYNEESQISHLSHIFGAVAGILVGTFVLHNVHITYREKVIGRISFVLYIILLLIGFSSRFYISPC
jgi:hypothetical protein